MQCDHCGKQIPDRAAFCSGCGKDLRAGAEPAPPASGRPAWLRYVPIGILALVLGAAGGSATWWLTRPGSAVAQDLGVYPFVAGGKAGLVDVTGKVIAEPTWDNLFLASVNGRLTPFSEGLMVVSMGGRYGFVDARGRIVITPQFDMVKPFQEGLAAVSLKSSGRSLWGYIDKEGRYVVNPQFQSAMSFRDGLAAVSGELGQGFIDRAGRFVISPEPRVLGDFNEGRAAVRIGEWWGFLDRSGKNVIRPQFRSVSSFSEGLAPVAIGDKWGYCDRDGKIVINPQFDFASVFRDGLAVVTVAGDPATIDKEGRFVLQPRQLPIVGGAANLLAPSPYLAVSQEAGVGLITRSGKWVLQPSRAIETVDRVLGKVLQARVGGEPALVTWAGAILTGPYKGSTLAQASEAIGRMQEERVDREVAAKVDQAGALFRAGQYQGAMRLCDEALAARPAHAEARRLKDQVAQTLSILGGN